MNAFLRGFFSLFSWTDCFHYLSPRERVNEILENFYLDYPEIEKDDLKALEKDSRAIIGDFYDTFEK